jgi:hypothetical protein
MQRYTQPSQQEKVTDTQPYLTPTGDAKWKAHNPLRTNFTVQWGGESTRESAALEYPVVAAVPFTDRCANKVKLLMHIRALGSGRNSSTTRGKKRKGGKEKVTSTKFSKGSQVAQLAIVSSVVLASEGAIPIPNASQRPQPTPDCQRAARDSRNTAMPPARPPSAASSPVLSSRQGGAAARPTRGERRDRRDPHAADSTKAIVPPAPRDWRATHFAQHNTRPGRSSRRFPPGSTPPGMTPFHPLRDQDVTDERQRQQGPVEEGQRGKPQPGADGRRGYALRSTSVRSPHVAGFALA